VETWTVAATGSPALKLPQAAPCQETAGLLAWNGPDHIPLPPARPPRSAAGPAQKPEALVAKRRRVIPVDREVIVAP
jgi:hypothetical protein